MVKITLPDGSVKEFEGPVTAELDERSDPAPEGEESTETEDES